MKAIVFDNELKLDNNYTKPTPNKGEALIKVKLAGICNTDYEITKGYMGYVGILGHEFVGIVESVNSDKEADQKWVGKRVVAEISWGCDDPTCEWCAQKNYRHCPNRHTIGIWKKDVRWLNKPFVPMQATGFMLMLVSFVIGFGTINWSGLLASVTGFPTIIFFTLWIVMMGTMGWYRKNKFDNSARANWTAQIINCVGQGALLLGILLA